MSRSRRSLADALRAEARRVPPGPDDAFVDRLDRRLQSIDLAAVDSAPSNVVAFRRRLTRGAAIGVVAGVMTAAGAAAVAIVTVHHLAEPSPTTTTPPVVTAAPEAIPHTTIAPPTSVITTTTAPDTTTRTVVPATTVVPTTNTSPATTLPPTTAAPISVSVPQTVPSASTAATPASTTPPTTPALAPPTTAAAVEPPTTAAAPPTTPPPSTDAPSTTEVHTPAALQLACSTGAGAITCAWSAVPDGTDHVVVLRSTPSEPRGRVFFPAAGATSYSDISAIPGLTYTYLVHALDAAGMSLAHSNAVTVSCCG